MRFRVVFANLIKDIHHEMMFKVPFKVGVRDRPLRLMNQLYKDFKIELTVSKSKNGVLLSWYKPG